VEDDSVLKSVVPVRDAFEHFDEGLDVATRPEVMCVVDRYISNRTMIVTASHEQGVTLGLRCYQAGWGVLFHNENELDLFAVDETLFDLRERIELAKPSIEARIEGRPLMVVGGW
jgi:hypothetical protein